MLGGSLQNSKPHMGFTSLAWPKEAQVFCAERSRFPPPAPPAPPVPAPADAGSRGSPTLKPGGLAILGMCFALFVCFVSAQLSGGCKKHERLPSFTEDSTGWAEAFVGSSN